MVGMFIGFFIWPPYSDTYGRRNIFVITMLLSCLAQGVILYTNSIHKLFLFMIILGTTFSGKNIVALNYAVESVPASYQKLVVSTYWGVELVSIILWSFYYQKLDKNWFPLQATYFVLGILVFFVALLVLPESPKYLHSKQRFQEAKDSLTYMAKLNRCDTYSPIFLFDNEYVEEEVIEDLIDDKRNELVDLLKEEPQNMRLFSS